MKKGDVSKTPQIAFTGTKATIEAWTGAIEGMEAIATDTQERGAFVGAAWRWSALEGGGGGGGGTNSLQIDCSGGTSDTYGVLSGAVNGSNNIYTVSLGSYVTGGLQMYLNGQLLTQGSGEDWTETDPASGTLTLTNAPVSGDVLIAIYKFTATTSGNADTLDGWELSAILAAIAAVPMPGRGNVSVDFGTGALSQVATVTDPLAATGSYIVASVLCEETANNTEDEIMIQPFDVKIKSQTTGSFDIVVTSLIGKAMREIPVSYILMN